MKISSKYSWLGDIADAPKTIVECVKLGDLNTTEYPGPKSNPEIIALAKEAGVSNIYKSDETAWCAVAATVICLRALKVVPFTAWDRLRAKSFLKFGVQVKEPMLGDVLVFGRKGGQHVGFYVGEDDSCYHVCGGNQSNQFNVIRVKKDRLMQARRPIYNVQPASVKKIFLSNEGEQSENEA